MKRRDFLQRTTAGVAGLCAPALSGIRPFGATNARAQRIVVMGAGMAGLGTALELVAQGHDVTILEARRRPGGRVFSLRDGFPDGLYADAGAMQVYDTHSRVRHYIEQFGLILDARQSTAPAWILNVMGRRIEMRPGQPVAWPFPLHDDERSLDNRGLWTRYVEPELTAIREADARGALLDSFGDHDRITFSEYVRARGASEAAIAILKAGLPVGLGDGGDHHSALNLLREAAWRQPHRASYTIRGGTDRLPAALAARLGSRIHYGTPVVRIEQHSNGVRVMAQQGADTRTYTADRIVVAIPFAVLRNVAIDPPLPAAKRNAIDRLENTSVVKVFVQTRTRFWIEDGFSGDASSDAGGLLVSERSINQPGERGILEVYVAGSNARVLCGLEEGERFGRVVRDLAGIFPRVADQQEGGTSKCWDLDPWSRGAYAWFRPGQMTSMLPHIATPEGRIHFAGDHTSPTPGWMEGALHSAERVVREIAATGN